MQQIRLWEIDSDKKLQEIQGDQIDLERSLQDWLVSDISVLDPKLLVIGQEVEVAPAGRVDLLCLDNEGDTVIVELKKGQTPREVAAQVLDYASLVEDFSRERIEEIASKHFGKSGLLHSAFLKQFGRELPEELNINHRCLIVAESTDGSTERIVRYLSSMKVPINMVTVQHFKDSAGKSILAQVYLIQPSESEARMPRNSKRTVRQTVTGLQATADRNGIGELWAQLKDGVQGTLSAQPYKDRMWYQLRLHDGGVRTVLIAYASATDMKRGLEFIVHATRIEKHLRVDPVALMDWLPSGSDEADVSRWSGSSDEERASAEGRRGFFKNTGQVEKFVDALSDAKDRSST